MKSNKTVIDETTVKVEIETTLAENSDIVNRIYKDLAEKINAPGFRKGKVPKAVINSKLGVNYVLNEVINEVINSTYQKAATELSLKVLSSPAVSVDKHFDLDNDASILKFSAEVSVRPDVKIPDFTKETIQVDIQKVDDKFIESRLELMKQNILRSDESKKDVKIDDEFAKQFGSDNLKELKVNIKKDLELEAVGSTISVAGDKLLDKLLEITKVPLPQNLVDEQANRFLHSNEEQGKEHKHTPEEEKLAKKRAEHDLKSQILLDNYADLNDIKVEPNEVMNYASNMAMQYGIDPNQFVQMLIQQGNFPMVAAEVSRSKTLSHMIKQVKVVDQSKKPVDYSIWIQDSSDSKNSKPKSTKPKRDAAKKGSTAKTAAKAESKPKGSK